MRRTTRLLLAGALVVALMSTTGCFRRERLSTSGTAPQTVSESVPIGTATSAVTRISMGAGELRLEGADLGSDALTGDFLYAPSSLKPEIESEQEGDALQIAVRHPTIQKLPFRNLASEWDLRLADGLPTELVLNMGAGDSSIDLSDVDVTELSVNLGAGESRIDLTGERAHDVRGLVQAGAGEIVIRLPKDVPVRITGRQDGIGEWSYDGFTTDGNAVVNEAWSADASENSIELNVQRGVGNVRLELAD
ncbi:MAG TPA: toast rack family protein [Coriobacteriia bacterium]|nr:toast rack family protein [Coriobacteriia bacterium]